MLGISYGGEVALRFAIAHGERVERLLLFNTTARTLQDIMIPFSTSRGRPCPCSS